MTTNKKRLIFGTIFGILIALVTFLPGTVKGKFLAPFTQKATYVQSTATEATPGSSYVPPIGIPAPDFGINEQYTMYNIEANRNTSDIIDSNGNTQPHLTYSPDGNGGYYTHYIDNTSPNATDIDNVYGTALKPRMTIPTELPAGSVVEVHGGPYEYYGTGRQITSWINRIYARGTKEKPIFVRGINSPRFNAELSIYATPNEKNSYVILEGLNAYIITIGAPGDHIVLRNSDIHGDQNGGGIAVYRPTESRLANPNNALSYIVIYNITLHDNGIWDPKLATGDRDIGTIQIGWEALVDHVWVLDSDIYHTEGDSVQVNAAPGYPDSNVNHIYIGRNKGHDNKQSSIFVKQAKDVIISQNDAYGIRLSSSATGAAMGNSDEGPESVWFIFNRIHNSDMGFKFSGADPGDYYMVGNLIYDIHDLSGNSGYHNEWGKPGLAVADWHGLSNKYFVNNTIYDTDYGYAVSYGGSGSSLTLANNIGITKLIGSQAEIITNDPSTHLTNNIESSSSQFVNPSATVGDFHLTSNATSAIDAGTESSVYQTFQDLYGKDFPGGIANIRVDFDGNPRPTTGPWDIGAFEYQETTPPPTTYTLTIPTLAGGTITGNTSSYNSGTTANLTAVPNTGYIFANWTGCTSTLGTTCTVSMTGNKGVTANFTLAPITTGYTLTIQSNTGGSITGNASPYKSGSSATLVAIPQTGYAFSSWTGCGSKLSTICIVTMSSNKTVTAKFISAPNGPYNLTVLISGTGQGTISGLKTLYNKGTTASITAKPKTGSIFIGWSGACTNTTGKCVIKMDSHKSVIAIFEKK